MEADPDVKEKIKPNEKPIGQGPDHVTHFNIDLGSEMSNNNPGDEKISIRRIGAYYSDVRL